MKLNSQSDTSSSSLMSRSQTFSPSFVGVLALVGVSWLSQYITIPVLNIDFDVEGVIKQALNLTSHSWETGALAQALLELHNPELTVFGLDPFPNGHAPAIEEVSTVLALRYVKPFIWTNDTDLLTEGEGSSADPASLGIMSLLLSVNDVQYLEAARRQAYFLVHQSTRFHLNSTHSAISHRDNIPQLWGDFVFMVPPFLAYFGVYTQDIDYIVEAIRQCLLYDEVLATSITLPNGSQIFGSWKHIVTQPANIGSNQCCTDSGVWLTSNAWALAGISRVLATLMKWRPPLESNLNESEYNDFALVAQKSLLKIIHGMFQCIKGQARDKASGLLPNYLDGIGHLSSSYSFGDAAGTALIASTIYRLSVLMPDVFGHSEYLHWAEESRIAVTKQIDPQGKVHSVADVFEVPSKKFLNQTSEGQSMTIMLYCAYRDCVQSGVCQMSTSWWKMLRSIWFPAFGRYIGGQ